MFEQLRHHQDNVLAIVDRCDALLRADRRDAAALAQSRWALTRALTAYSLWKHGRVFDPILASRDPARVAVARALKDRCLAMGETFRAHVLRWSAADVVGQWEIYRPETLALLERLRVHLDRERNDMRALESGRTPPASPPSRYGAGRLSVASPTGLSYPRDQGS